MSDALGKVADLVRRESGVVTRPAQLPSLRAAVARVHPGLGPDGLLAAAAGERSDEVLARLIEEVTVKETYFLRNRGELDAIDWPGLLGAARADGADGICAWNPACATGEEAHSLALLAREALGPAAEGVSILGTDIAGSAVRHARHGRYGRRAVRSVPADQARRWFTPRADGLVVNDELRDLVRFARHNLFRDPFPPAGQERFDLIVCRNVLIYFDPPTVRQTVASLNGALTPHGILVLSAADRLTLTAASGPSAGADPAPRAARVLSRARRSPPRPDPRRAVPPRLPAPGTLDRALAAADAGQLETALELTRELLEADPADPVLHFVRGMAHHAAGDAAAAVSALRRAVYFEPRFARAAFELGRAQDSLGDRDAARRSYRAVLHTLDGGGGGHLLLDSGDVEDVAAACRARLAALTREAA